MTVTPSIPGVLSVRVPGMGWCEHNPSGPRREAVRWSPAARVVGDTLRWPAPEVLTDRATSSGPSIVGTGSNACMAWRGAGADRRIWYSRQDQLAPGAVPGDNRYRWGPQLVTPAAFTTSGFPALARYGTRTFLFWRAMTVPTEMRWSELRGQDWTHPRFGPGAHWAYETLDWMRAVDGVAVAGHRGRLYCAYRVHLGGGTRIALHAFDQDLMVVEENYTSWRTTEIPALASDGDNLFMAWRGLEDLNIHWAVVSGSTPSGEQVLRDRATAAGPSLGVVDRGRLVMVWVGAPGDTAVWWSEYRNGRWGPQQAFSDRKMYVALRASLA
ncbi:hypothetical protein ACQPYA_16885 [Micromonospora sp. CA-263727]|uniref:hypothetical protein n=1 Tax=Micromonospora sp. CA-263727 TaxID=3239967 RepID=UPI003D9506A4